jgi:hypothetical protein
MGAAASSQTATPPPPVVAPPPLATAAIAIATAAAARGRLDAKRKEQHAARLAEKDAERKQQLPALLKHATDEMMQRAADSRPLIVLATAKDFPHARHPDSVVALRALDFCLHPVTTGRYDDAHAYIVPCSAPFDAAEHYW